MFNLPNLLTLANLLCGCLAINAVYNDNALEGLVFFGLSLLFDLLDGLVARALNQSSPLGRELDSLADMVSFGLLPGVIFYHLIDVQSGIDSMTILPVLGFVFTAFAALRLAKFNLDDRQTKDFMGLNTPAASIAIMGLYMNSYLECTGFSMALSSTTPAILGFELIFCVLLLIDIPMLSFKFVTKDKKRLMYQGLLILGGVIILILMQTCALPFLILWYIIYSIIRYIIEKYRS